MKARFISWIFPLLLFVTGPVSAQSDSTKKTVFKHSIGAAAGFTTGYGISYRFWPKKIGAQLTFLPWLSANNTWVSTGVTFLFRFVEMKKANLFVYQGNHWLYHREEQHATSGALQWTSEGTDYSNGIGLGMEFIIARRISFNIMFGYASYHNRFWDDSTGEIGLFYKF